jgi:hypothetical protein
VTRFLNCFSTIYRNLLWVCPKELRRDFGPDMELVFADDLSESWLEAGIPGVIRVLRCAVGELLPIALSNAASAPGLIGSVISCGLCAICFGGELMLARAHTSTAGATGVATLALTEAIRTVVVWPSLMAALVSFVAVRVCAPNTSLSLIAPTSDSDA